MTLTVKEYCSKIYEDTYESEKERLTTEFLKVSHSGTLSAAKENTVETAAQKEAIKTATIKGISTYNNVEVALIWKAVYETHIHRKSGIDNADIINKVIAADQSWKKSSGHAFEEMCKILGTAALQESGIEIILQRDLNTLIKAEELDNEPRDISWLKEQIKASIFDLFAIVNKENKKYCFGCIQSKTSIRDRVTRDREPSMGAMKSFFWSTCIVLDGDFLKLPKFSHMVNGGTTEHEHNGWHGMYVFSELHTGGRIYPIDLDIKNFKEHAIKASNEWLSQRQWFDYKWMATPQ
ncbi:MAG: BsaWI family type II restriction enzyme [Oscillospiraceae bacterium]|jgi:hypothetical protein|nr:BsaWI family type II restriction enzyme [Oscillospiraceae bacterium]